MSARQEKVRDALECLPPSYMSERRRALAEVEEWEQERLDVRHRLADRIAATRAAWLEVAARAEAAEARIVELEAALRNPGGTDL